MNTARRIGLALLVAAIMSCATTVLASQAGSSAGLSYQNPAAAERVPLTDELRKISSDALQATLVEVIDQSRAVQQVHWNVRGPLFYSLHDLLGDFYEQLNETVDHIAERRLALGFPADGSPSLVAAKANLGDVPSGMIADAAALDLLTKRYWTMSGRLQERITATSHDLATQGMLLDLATMIDKQLWLLRSFYPANGSE